MIEEKEIWIQSDFPGGEAEGPRALQPAIYLRYWKPEEGREPGTGKTLLYRYSREDPSFAEHWEVLYDW